VRVQFSMKATETLVNLCDTFSLLKAQFFPFSFDEVEGVGQNKLSFQLCAKGGPFDRRTHCGAVHGPDCCVAFQL